MDFWWIVIVALIFPVAITIILTLQTLEDRRRRQEGLPPKKHHNIKDWNIISVYVHDKDD